MRVFSHTATPTNRGAELLPTEIGAAATIATDIESHGVRHGGSLARRVCSYCYCYCYYYCCYNYFYYNYYCCYHYYCNYHFHNYDNDNDNNNYKSTTTRTTMTAKDLSEKMCIHSCFDLRLILESESD